MRVKDVKQRDAQEEIKKPIQEKDSIDAECAAALKEAADFKVERDAQEQIKKLTEEHARAECAAAQENVAAVLEEAADFKVERDEAKEQIKKLPEERDAARERAAAAQYLGGF